MLYFERNMYNFLILFDVQVFIMLKHCHSPSVTYSPIGTRVNTIKHLYTMVQEKHHSIYNFGVILGI